MKRLFPFLIALVSVTTVYAQETEGSHRDLGLVAYLAEVKFISETKMQYVISQEKYKEDAKSKRINAAYAALRLHVDQLVLQVTADSKRKNNIKPYKNLDDHFKNGKPVSSKAYAKLLTAIESRYEQVTMFTYSSALSGASFEEITGAFGAVWSVIESARDFREKKVAGLAELLDKLRLKSIEELKNPKEEDKK